jgi:acyl-CoA synthetase (AMP-forming)/AMP-acid ligase II
MHPREVAARTPGKAAIVMAGSSLVVTFSELNQRANRAAQLFRSLGLRPGDGIAICLENHPCYFELCWGAHNAGLYYTPISSRLKTHEIAFIVGDCGARALFTSIALSGVVGALPAQLPVECAAFVLDGQLAGFRAYDDATALLPAAAVEESTQGAAMMYSSGTTGLPKGIRPPLPVQAVTELAPLPIKLRELYGFDEQTVYLSPAPLYHAAPLKFNLCVQACGGTCVVMEKFDASTALECIERYRVTHSQWVPTMFIRMLKLPDEVRQRHDLNSQRTAIHAAAPCPVEVKERMLAWWGPIIHEYYSGSESIGMCAIAPQEWLQRKGSVGRAVRGVVHILNEQGNEAPPGTDGLVYFETATPLCYHNDPGKTAQAHNERGWATIGDIGHVDADGYLYLTDRRDFVIISGGVNIYPQEAENLLDTHPKIQDVAVFGVPNSEYGEEVKAVVVLQDPNEASPQLASELIEYCRARLSTIKCPKSVEFASELPREPTGKLLKKQLRQRYWSNVQ